MGGGPVIRWRRGLRRTRIFVRRPRPADEVRTGISAAPIVRRDAGEPPVDAHGSRGRRGLDELVRRSWPHIEAAVETALQDAGHGPVLLTEASPLARYDNMGLLSRWSDLGASRSRAVWLVLPQLAANPGPLVAGRPVPLAAPSQYLPVDNDWVDAATSATTTATQSTHA